MDNRSGGLAGPRVSEDIRCPSCSRLLVMRSGPAITPHLAHRPRQSCRNRPGRPRSSPIRLEQLTLFDLEPLAIAPAADPPRRSGPVALRHPAPDPVGFDEPGFGELRSGEPGSAEPSSGQPGSVKPGPGQPRFGKPAGIRTAQPVRRRRRRRRAWLPRLIRWFKAQRR
jgi:hypothetical protein